EARGWGNRGGDGFADVGGDGGAFAEVSEEGGEFVGVGGGGEEFDAAVGEVADPAADIVSCGDLPGGVAEADPLHATGVENATGDHGGGTVTAACGRHKRAVRGGGL